MYGHDDLCKFGISMMYDNFNNIKTIRPLYDGQVSSPLNWNPKHSSFQ